MPCRRQAIIWTNAGMLLFWPLGTNCSDIETEIFNIFIQENAFEIVVWKMAAILPLYLWNVITCHGPWYFLLA